MARKAFVVDTGLCAGQVLQRGRGGVAVVAIRGETAHGSIIEAQVTKGKEIVLAWHRAGKRMADGNKWEADIKGIPTGGPYAVSLRVKDEEGRALGGTDIKGIWVGDLWVLAGQSNMQGVGLLDGELEKSTRLVRSYSMAEKWELAEEPLHWLLDSPDSCHWECKPENRARLAQADRKTRMAGAGLGLTFAKEIVKRVGIPVGLIPCAHGGTSMDQWSPERKPLGGASLYGSMLRRIEAVGGKVKGVLWYQGESDGKDPDCLVFKEKFKAFIEAIRADLEAPKLPFYYVQLGAFVGFDGDSAAWNAIREAQRESALEISDVGMVSAIDLPLDDQIHVSTDSLKRLGKRLADLACSNLYGEKKVKPGPRVVKATFLNKERTALRLDYEGVNGQLVSPCRLNGFSAHDKEGYFKPRIFDARIEGARGTSVLIRFTIYSSVKGSTLYYGGGLNPFCTLTDKRGHAAPAFGPLQLDDVEVCVDKKLK